ncbi:MAG: NAD(P)/FAD-dependent oxidoreductase [Ruminococcaceae bacterium]|nr:NAD(P)/FAD-dependent oxidoreductase [Oscillospiraceae bacterium]
MYDIAIIGAGVIGGMIARNLSKYDLNIAIIEKENDVAMGATKANSAIVHAGFDAKEGTLKAKLNVEGSKMMEQIAKELGVKYEKNGSMVIGFDNDDKKTLETLLERGMKNGVAGLKLIEKGEIKALEPNLSGEVKYALFAPSGAIICPYELTIAAIGNAMDNGVELKRNFLVKNIEKKDFGFEVFSSNESIKTKYIINAAGVFADEISKMAGDSSFKITPRRGEYILLDNECKNLVSHTIFKTPDKMGKGILVSPTVDKNIILGPTAEDIIDKDDKSTTTKGFEKIISLAKKYTDKVEINKSITSFCGLRAVADTDDFIINSPIDGFINVAGIDSPGLSSSPAIALYVENILKDVGFKFKEKENYNPTRKSMTYFKDASIEEKNEIIKKDKSFGKIVCRCEIVTEGEIKEAIRLNPQPYDLDGVKRRTRAQMGRCQGGFCTPYIVKLLSEELKIPYEDVTKSGKGSKINVGKTKEA